MAEATKEGQEPTSAEPVGGVAETDAPTTGGAAGAATGVLGLQRRAGNRSVRALLDAAQAALEVGRASDPLEHEADRVARQVVGSLRSGARQQHAPVDSISRRVQRRATIGAEGGEVDDDTEARLQREIGRGRPLDDTSRQRMESAFGADFGAVRVHDDAASVDLSNQLGAKAFTVGNDIFFRGGAPDTSGGSGQELLAHELTHVVQQGAAAKRAVQREEAEEIEGAEGEGEEADEDEAVFGTLPDIDLETELGPVEPKDPGDQSKDRSAPVKAPAQRRATAPAATADAGPGEVLSVRANCGSVDVSTPRVDSAPSGESGSLKRTAVSGLVNSVNWTNPGGDRVEPFGAESFKPSFTKLNYFLLGDQLNINFDLKAKCSWGVNSGGHKNVETGTESFITAESYPDIAKDMKPILIEKSWESPYRTYWSKSLTERHEKFHSTDDKGWVEGPGKAHLMAYIDKQTVTLTPKEKKSGKVKSKVKAIMVDAIDDLFSTNFNDFYKGGATTYHSYRGEERAYFDGKAPHDALVDKIVKRGEALAEAKKKKAEEKAAKKAAAAKKAEAAKKAAAAKKAPAKKAAPVNAAAPIKAAAKRAAAGPARRRA